MNIVTIKEVKGVVTCAADGTADHTFNVKNATDKALKVGMQLSLDGPTRGEWLQIDGSTEHELDVETMTQVSVKIQVPSDGAPGKYSYRLRVYDPANPGEVFTDGDPVYFEVPEKKKVAPEKEQGAKKPFKWWIPVAIAVGLIVIGVGSWLLWPSEVEAPGIVSFSASPSSISPGGSATLSWQTENAMSVHIDGIGSVQLSGTRQVRPSQTATYLLIAENERGAHIQKEATVAVRVNPPRILSFEADRQTIQKGESSNLHWRVSDAAAVSINGKQVQSSSRRKQVTPAQTTTYTLVAENRVGKTTRKTLTVRVKASQLQGTYTIQQISNGRYLDAHEGSKDNSVVTRNRQSNTTQAWILTPLGNNTYTIRQKSNGRYMDAHEGSKDNSVVTRNRQNNTTQVWILTPRGNNTYTIRQKSNGRYMDAHEGSNDNSVVTRDRQNNNTQRWQIKPL